MITTARSGRLPRGPAPDDPAGNWKLALEEGHLMAGISRPTTRFVGKIAAFAALAVASAAALTLAAPASQAAANCSNGYVALTFDDGPGSSTSALLSALQSAGARATMFNIGNNVQQNRSLAQAQQSAGMWIGNHSWTHPHMTQLSAAQMTSELSQTQQAIQQATGTTPRLFRPPYGETNSTLKSVQAQMGLTEVLWTVDSQDWNGASTAQIVQAANNLQSGGVMLMHDGYATTRGAISQIVSNLNNRGLCPGMISPSTGRAVAPDGSTNPTTPSNPGSCSVSVSRGQEWTDRFNVNLSVSGSNTWTVTIRLNGGQSLQNSWNASVSGSTGTLTARPNGAGNNFGITLYKNGNNTTPTATCA